MDSSSSTQNKGKGVVMSPGKRKDYGNTTSAPMKKHIVIGNQSTISLDDHPKFPPCFKSSDAEKYKHMKLEKEYHVINVCDPKGVVPYICLNCRNGGGPSKELCMEISFFTNKITEEKDPKYLTIPCFLRHKFDDIRDGTIKIKSFEGKTYEGCLIKIFGTILLGSSDWHKFVADHDLSLGDEVQFCFQNSGPHLLFGFRPIKDIYKNYEGHIRCNTVCPPILRVTSSKEVVHDETPVHELVANDEAASHHLDSFEHYLVMSHIKYVLKIPKARTDKLQVPPIGEVDLIMHRPPVTVNGWYKIVNTPHSVDGRLSVNGGWPTFVRETGLEPNMKVMIDASLVHGKLTFQFSPL